MSDAGASKSIPNLRAKQPFFRLLFILGPIAIGVAIFIIVKMAKEESDPGARACDRLAELSKTDPEKWSDLTEAIIDFIQSRSADSAKPISVIEKGADNRCRAIFKAIRDTMPYGRYDKLVGCMGKIETTSDARDCFAAAYPKK